ncbi:hypothetical protein [Nocardia sp. NPDC051570]|uniref:hypothetical protein n=1 Tax=Nocardia sp. NPDC051570 TaxID=3364324 RepID=UPI0037B5C7A8
MRIALVMAAAALAVGTVAGCGGGGGAHGTGAATPTTGAIETSAAVSAAPQASTTPQSSGQKQVTVDPAAYLMDGPSGSGYYFATPSGSFGCVIFPRPMGPANEGGDVAGCQGRQAAIPSGGKDCGTNPDYLQVADSVGPGGARQACVNQPIFTLGAAGAKTLAYGSRLSVNGYTCLSEQTGVTCTNDATKHGFTIARELNRIF